MTTSKGSKPKKNVAPKTIGQAYGGGFYIGKIKDGGVNYYLIAAPKATGEAVKKWADSTKAAASHTNGPGITAAILNNQITTYPAAQFCKDLAIGGFDDWYLPAKDELELLMNAGTALAAIGEGFESYYYWSASEYSATSAWSQAWNSSYPGHQNNGNKITAYYVRAVRRLAI